MKTLLNFLLIIVILGATSLACQAGLLLNQEDPNLLFRDDFSTQQNGWDQIMDAEGVTDYYEGGYRIQVLNPGYDYWSNPGLEFADIIISVQAKKLGGPDENLFGVLCRYQDEYNFYSLFMGNDGYFGVIKVKSGEQEFIGMDRFLKSSEINQGDGAVNEIQANCIGNNLSLFANRKLLITVQDNDFSTGDVGLVAGTFDIVGVDILFDNFVVRKP